MANNTSDLTTSESQNPIDEQSVINAMDAMCIQSCSPQQYEAWEELKGYLMKTRKYLKEPPTIA